MDIDFQKKVNDFRSFLSKITECNLNTDELLNEATSMALDIYNCNDCWRHDYSLVLSHIIDQQKEPELMMNMLVMMHTNLEAILSRVYIKCRESEDNENRYHHCRRSLQKVIDFVNLELVRFSEKFDNERRHNEEINHLENLVSEYEQKLQEVNQLSNSANQSFLRLESSYNKLQNNVSKVEKNLSSQKVESITILGVFSSIVAVLVAGVGLSSAIFANMSEVGSFLLYGLSIFIMLFVMDILFLLFNFLREMANKNRHSSRGIIGFNIIFGLIALSFLYMQFYYIP